MSPFASQRCFGVYSGECWFRGLGFRGLGFRVQGSTWKRKWKLLCYRDIIGILLEFYRGKGLGYLGPLLRVNP